MIWTEDVILGIIRNAMSALSHEYDLEQTVRGIDPLVSLFCAQGRPRLRLPADW